MVAHLDHLMVVGTLVGEEVHHLQVDHMGLLLEEEKVGLVVGEEVPAQLEIPLEVGAVGHLVVDLVVEEQVHHLQVDPMELLQGDHQVGLEDLVVEKAAQHLEVDLMELLVVGHQEEVVGLVVEEVVHPLQADLMELLLEDHHQ